MEHSDFSIDATFWCGERQWRCTAVGRRTVVAIRIDSVAVAGTEPGLRRMLGRAAAEAEGWFNGPPYAVVEVVFDEDGQEGCSLQPDPSDRAAARPA